MKVRKKIEVSIVIVHYKVPRRIIACIESIYNSSPKVPCEIIVVDNDEKPILGKILKGKFPECIYIANNKNLGFGAANNIGAKQTSGTYLFFLNPDTIVYPKTIETLIQSLKKEKNIGAVAPLFLNPKGKPYPLQGTTTLTPFNSLFAFSFLNTIFPHNPVSSKYWLHNWNKKTPKEVDVIPGTAFVISRKLFFNIGQFDEQYFLFFEEHDLGIRLRKKRIQTYYRSGSSSNALLGRKYETIK